MHNPEWHSDVLRRVDDVTSSADKRLVKRFRADLLKRIATRLEQFSDEGCLECDKLKDSVDRLVLMYEQVAQGTSIDQREHKALFLTLIKHLRSTHKLIEEGTNQSIWLSLGLVMGVALQNTFGPTSIALGLSLGIVVGSSFDASAKKAGKVL